MSSAFKLRPITESYIGTDLVSRDFLQKFNGRDMKLSQSVPSLMFGVLFDLIVVYLPLLLVLLPQEKSPVKIIIGPICVRCRQAKKKALCCQK